MYVPGTLPLRTRHRERFSSALEHILLPYLTYSLFSLNPFLWSFFLQKPVKLSEQNITLECRHFIKEKNRKSYKDPFITSSASISSCGRNMLLCLSTKVETEQKKRESFVVTSFFLSPFFIHQSYSHFIFYTH